MVTGPVYLNYIVQCMYNEYCTGSLLYYGMQSMTAGPGYYGQQGPNQGRHARHAIDPQFWKEQGEIF